MVRDHETIVQAFGTIDCRLCCNGNERLCRGDVTGTIAWFSYPAGWQNWAVIAVSHRTDNKTSRVILENAAAGKKKGDIDFLWHERSNALSIKLKLGCLAPFFRPEPGADSGPDQHVRFNFCQREQFSSAP